MPGINRMIGCLTYLASCYQSDFEEATRLKTYTNTHLGPKLTGELGKRQEFAASVFSR